MTPSKTNDKPWSKWHKRLHDSLQASPSLLPKESYLVLSISGGQDSMALMKIILDLKRIYKWKIFIWHGDHGWHKNSRIVKDNLKVWCSKNNLMFHSNQINKNEVNTEEKARDWRYSCLIKLAEDLLITNQSIHSTFILTGHTGSDRTETFILNLARGADIRGLSSIQVSRDLKTNIKLVRPFLCFNRKETHEICKDLELPFWIDPSNQNTIIRRNFIRHEIIPRLEKIHPGCSLRISELSERLSLYKEEQESMAKFILQSIKLDDGLSRKKLNQFPINTKVTLLAYWLKINELPNLNSKSLKQLSLDVEISKPPGLIRFGKHFSIKWTKDIVQIIDLTQNNF